MAHQIWYIFISGETSVKGKRPNNNSSGHYTTIPAVTTLAQIQIYMAAYNFTNFILKGNDSPHSNYFLTYIKGNKKNNLHATNLSEGHKSP